MERILQDIEQFLRTGAGDFDSLAPELFSYQFQRNPAYRAFCEVQGWSPATVQRWQDIPAVPIGAFKSAELATFPAAQAAAVFESSATTTGIPSRHYIKDLRYYETSLKTSFYRFVLGPGPTAQHGVSLGQAPFFILTSPPSEAPRSSLSWMMDVVKRAWGGPGSDYFIQRGRLDELHLCRSLRKAANAGEPVILLGTTLAFLRFFDYATQTGQRYALPPGSRLMDTGGMKTEKRQLTRADFIRQVGKIFSIPETHCINEYGMCELSSQFYGYGASSYLEGPAWTRTVIIDPKTAQPATAGKAGLLRHFDLANVHSVMAIQTEDVGVKDEEGFVFQGRDASAEKKGCSLAAEALLA